MNNTNNQENRGVESRGTRRGGSRGVNRGGRGNRRGGNSYEYVEHNQK